MSLNSEHFAQIHRAFLDAFDTGELRLFVRIHLNANLDEITLGQNLAAITLELIAWADRQGRLREMIDAALRQNPGNPQLQDLTKQPWIATADSLVSTGEGNFAGRDINIYARTQETRDEQYLLVMNSGKNSAKWLASRKKLTFREFDLARRNLSGIDLSKADLQGASLKHAKLRGTNLREADLRDAHLEAADLRDAKLEGANLQDAKLENARLEGARYDANTIWPQGFSLPPSKNVWSLKSILLSPSRPIEYALSVLFWGSIVVLGVYNEYSQDPVRFMARLNNRICVVKDIEKAVLSSYGELPIRIIDNGDELLTVGRSKDGLALYGLVGDSYFWIETKSLDCSFDKADLPVVQR
ncbi:MAG TPA: pentapeptide repeat-containing protein [Chloroflexi bacterium]|nr:pentapeptide repeat-containing protein [Chloroflexota bacterium]